MAAGHGDGAGTQTETAVNAVRITGGPIYLAGGEPVLWCRASPFRGEGRKVCNRRTDDSGRLSIAIRSDLGTPVRFPHGGADFPKRPSITDVHSLLSRPDCSADM
jgi:hypothetical protein